MRRNPWQHANRRRRACFEPAHRLLVVCEGEVTEPTYFRHLRHQVRTQIQVVVQEKAGVPKSVVELASELKRQAEKDAKKEGDSFLSYDEVWCVFDVDQHPRLREAIEQATARDIKLAISNPCFELWIALHYQDQRAHIERDKVQALCRKHIHGYDKFPPCKELFSRYQDAADRAIALQKWQIECGRRLENPWTDVHSLVTRIRELAQGTPLKQIKNARHLS